MTAAPRVLFLQHQDNAGPGYLSEQAHVRGFTVEIAHPIPTRPTASDYDLLIPLGSDASVCDDSTPYLATEQALLRQAVDQNIPVFGVCFGAQLLASVLGGDVQPAPHPEIGWFPVHSTTPELIEEDDWLIWHFDAITTPPAATELARTQVGSQAFCYGPHVGVQFHPEPTPNNVASWAQTDHDTLTQQQISGTELLTETRARVPTTRHRAHALFDRICHRAGLPTNQ